MTNEEKQAKLAAVKTIEDAYALAKECGFTGTMEDFKAMCGQASNNEQMDIDAMDNVAGGFGLSDLWDWITKPVSEKFGFQPDDSILNNTWKDPQKELRDMLGM